MNFKNIDELLEKGREKIKNFGIKLGKGVIASVLITSFLLSPVVSKANEFVNTNPVSRMEINQSQVTHQMLEGKTFNELVDFVKDKIGLEQTFKDSGFQNLNDSVINFKKEKETKYSVNGEIVSEKQVDTEETIMLKNFMKEITKNLDGIEKITNNSRQMIRLKYSYYKANGEMDKAMTVLKTEIDVIKNHTKELTQNLDAKKVTSEYVTSSKILNNLEGVLISEVLLGNTKTGLTTDQVDVMITDKKSEYQNENMASDRMEAIRYNKIINKDIDLLVTAKNLIIENNLKAEINNKNNLSLGY